MICFITMLKMFIPTTNILNSAYPLIKSRCLVLKTNIATTRQSSYLYLHNEIKLLVSYVF